MINEKLNQIEKRLTEISAILIKQGYTDSLAEASSIETDFVSDYDLLNDFYDIVDRVQNFHYKLVEAPSS